MKFSKFSPEFVAELLRHLADHEKFTSLDSLGAVSRGDVRNTLAELAEFVKESADKQPIVRKSQLNPRDLSQNATQVMSKLTPKEEEYLLQSFKISS